MSPDGDVASQVTPDKNPEVLGSSGTKPGGGNSRFLGCCRVSASEKGWRGWDSGALGTGGCAVAGACRQILVLARGHLGW